MPIGPEFPQDPVQGLPRFARMQIAGFCVVGAQPDRISIDIHLTRRTFQVRHIARLPQFFPGACVQSGQASRVVADPRMGPQELGAVTIQSVSYTHLTLPTS